MENKNNCNSENCMCSSSVEASGLTSNDDNDTKSLEETVNTEQETSCTCLAKTSNKPDQINMTGFVYNQIKYSIGKEPAETGGILGMSENEVDHIFIDSNPDWATSATYSPNYHAINACLKRTWTPKDIVYMGAIHSHPVGCISPSHEDKKYAQRLLDNNLNYDKAKPYFYIPIVQSSANSKTFEIYSYVAFYNNDEFIVEPIDLYIDGQKYKPSIDIPLNNFIRILSIFPPEIMATKNVICVGAGGARDYVENLARCGIKNFVLIDGDTISETNIATQGVYYSEINRSKTEVIKEKILDINPEANVVCIEKFLDDSLSDEDFLELVGDTCRKALKFSPTDVLIGGLTDSFFANARASRLALKYGTPYIEAGIYKNGCGAEILFSYPGVTPSCSRCANSSRYKRYAEGFKNDTTSEGCPVFTTDVLNGYKGHISLMLLMHNTNTRYGSYLGEFATRNFCQINLDPFNDLLPGVPFGSAQFFEQKPDHPDNGYDECPDCHGSGNLEKIKGKISDTRKIFG